MTTIEEARGKPVYTSDGERLGAVEVILDDVETRRPEWIAIAAAPAVGGRRLVPVEGSEVRDDGVFVAYSAQQVRATPEIEGDEISQSTERKLYSQYGLPYSERRSGTGLPERTGERETQRRESRSGGRSKGRSRSSEQPSRQEPTRAELYEEAKKFEIEGRSKMNKRELERAVERARGSGTSGGGGRESRMKANPVEVQTFLEGVGYPADKGELVREAKRQGASREVRATLERLPDDRYDAPTEVSEAIGNLS